MYFWHQQHIHRNGWVCTFTVIKVSYGNVTETWTSGKVSFWGMTRQPRYITLYLGSLVLYVALGQLSTWGSCLPGQLYPWGSCLAWAVVAQGQLSPWGSFPPWAVIPLGHLSAWAVVAWAVVGASCPHPYCGS